MESPSLGRSRRVPQSAQNNREPEDDCYLVGESVPIQFERRFPDQSYHNCPDLFLVVALWMPSRDLREQKMPRKATITIPSWLSFRAYRSSDLYLQQGCDCTREPLKSVLYRITRQFSPSSFHSSQDWRLGFLQRSSILLTITHGPDLPPLLSFRRRHEHNPRCCCPLSRICPQVFAPPSLASCPPSRPHAWING